MPPQPAWFHRLEEILTELRTLDSDYLDRQAVERLFRVRERRARQLMAGLPCLQIGNAVAVSRQALLGRVETAFQGDAFNFEMARRERVAARLETLRRQSAARRVRLPAPPDARDRLLHNLSPCIELRRGELRIRFECAEDLASKLFELSQAMANDWPAVQTALNEA